MNKKRFILSLLFIVFVIASLLIGVSSELTLKSLLSGNKEAYNVLFRSRMPRTLAIILSASSLSIAGLIMQSLSRNKFISPQTAGTNDAAAFGVLISFIFLGSIPSYYRLIFSFVFALISSLLFIFILNKIKFKNIIYVPLIGLMYGGLLSAVTRLIAYETNTLQLLSSLNLGTFSHINVLNGSMLLILVPVLLNAIIFAEGFNVASLGEEFATNLGVNYKKVLFLGLIVTSLIAASTYLVVGPLPFLGLIIPNIVSMYYGDNLKKNIIDIALLGSIFVLANDIISRLVIFPFELSVGFTMGITGAIIFILLIFKQVKNND